ncbi:MAG: hypothetical protein H0U63_04640 [Burkholderiales bacterium]|nr:hypothetical protein [Burkholderiales bacterium]
MKKSVLTDVQWTRPDGTPTQYFAELIQSLDRNGLGDGVSTTAPTNGQVMIYNSTTRLWTPGAN